MWVAASLSLVAICLQKGGFEGCCEKSLSSTRCLKDQTLSLKGDDMSQLDLFSDYKAYRKESPTSKSAWETKRNKLTLREEVFNLLSERPFSNEQIADSLGQPLSSICARINELKKIDLVVDSGKRTKSKYNKDVILWQRKDQTKLKESI